MCRRATCLGENRRLKIRTFSPEVFGRTLTPSIHLPVLPSAKHVPGIRVFKREGCKHPFLDFTSNQCLSPISEPFLAINRPQKAQNSKRKEKVAKTTMSRVRTCETFVSRDRARGA